MAWASTLTGTEHNTAVANVITGMASQDPQAAASAIDQLPDNNRRNQLIQQISQSWAGQDPQSTLAWLQTAASGPTYDNAVTAVLGQMGQSDPGQRRRVYFANVRWQRQE